MTTWGSNTRPDISAEGDLRSLTLEWALDWALDWALRVIAVPGGGDDERASMSISCITVSVRVRERPSRTSGVAWAKSSSVAVQLGGERITVGG